MPQLRLPGPYRHLQHRSLSEVVHAVYEEHAPAPPDGRLNEGLVEGPPLF